MAASDADEDGREAARMVLKGAEPVETLQTLSVMERILFLRRVPLFLDLPPADLKRVASIARESLFSKGSVIASQGDQGEDMYIIVSGEVAVQVHDEQNRQEEVARRRAGEYVGEMAIISHEPRMATLVAVGEVRALCIGQQAFGRLLRERPQTSMAVMRVLCQRLREG
jgi:CRP-like cAMP-binding protein